MSQKPTRIISTLFLFAGVLLLANAVFPIALSHLRFLLYPNPRLLDPTATSGRPATFVVNALGLASIDYTLATSWFENAPSSPSPPPSKVTHFSLSIPRLQMQDVTVEVNGTDLKQNAIHYPGTVLPGSYGNTVVFGHSSLPQLYRPGYPLTIFNPLPKAQVGDEVIVKYDGITYRYVIKKTQEVRPNQIEVLTQHYDRYQLTLITCVPLGTYWRRFVATAELVN